MKDRTEAYVAASGAQGLELKRGRGGIRDIEFATQLLQLVHGRHDSALRVRGTVPALAALADGGYVDFADAGWLRTGYRFLRRVEHALQLDGAGPPPAPPPIPRRGNGWRTLGFRDQPQGRAIERPGPGAGCVPPRSAASTSASRFRPLLEAFSGVEGPLRPDAAAERLAAFGFSDGERARGAVASTTRA